MTLRSPGVAAVVSGSTPIAGGTDTQVLFNDAAVVSGADGLTYYKTATLLTNTGGQIGSTAGTVTASTPFWTGTQTWSNAAVVFTAVKVNVTNTASNSSSLLLDLQVGGASKLTVDLFGQISGVAGGIRYNSF